MKIDLVMRFVWDSY